MADGVGCNCYAKYPGECVCDNVDWTPSEVYELREEIYRLCGLINNLGFCFLCGNNLPTNRSKICKECKKLERHKLKLFKDYKTLIAMSTTSS